MLDSSLKNARILIVDDQESNIILLESMLERDGYTDLRSITDSRQVSALFDEFQPDLILLDLHMPHLDGFAVMEQLRARIPSDDYLPILVLTADITPEVKLRALAAGARDFLTKPFDVAEVSLRIRNLLETHYLHRQQKNQNQVLEEKMRERTAELRQRADDLALINALNVAINRGDDLQKIIVLMADELHRIFHCIGTITAFPNPDKQSMHIQHIEFPSPLAGQIENLAGASIRSLPLKIPMMGDGQFAQTLRAGNPRVINDADAIKAVMAEYTDNLLLKHLVTPVYRLLGIGSMLLIPLISGTEIYGLLEMARTEATTESDLFRVQSIVGLLTTAIGRKLAEEHTRKSEKKYRELFEVNKDGIAIFLLNPDGVPDTFIELNNAAPKMLGYTREEMLKLTPLMLEPHVTQAQLQFRESEFKSKGTVNFETVIRHKDGHPVFAEFTSQTIQYEGNPAIMNIVRDVSERKLRENELQAIASLSAALRTASNRAEMLPVIVNQLSSLLQCDAVLAEMIDPLTGETVVEAAYGTWAALIGSHQPSGNGLNSIISQTRAPYHNNNMADDPQIGIPSYLLGGILAGAGVPLIAQDQLIGFLWVGRKNEIVQSEVRLLVAVANMSANAIYRATLYEQSQKNAAALTLAYDTTLEGWAHALELRDQETEGHTRRVMQMTVELAYKMGIDKFELENVRRGALLHDIGKMGIPDSVLLKPGTLNEREWEIMRRHPEYAYKFLEPIEYLHPVMDIPYCHHEKWDGSGYPRGLRGEEIPLVARIFAIVDVWDALNSDRPYRKAWATEQAIRYIVDQSSLHFDPKVVHSFLEMLGK